MTTDNAVVNPEFYLQMRVFAIVKRFTSRGLRLLAVSCWQQVADYWLVLSLFCGMAGPRGQVCSIVTGERTPIEGHE